MPRNLEIFNREDWFLREGTRKDGTSGYPFYYRFAITYSIAKYVITLTNNTFTDEMVKEEVENLLDTVEKNKPYYDAHFLELCSLGDNQGYVLVDQTDSYYPLIFYGENIDRNGKGRISSLKYSLKDIKEKLKDIMFKIYKLKNMEGWTCDFQQELYELYPYKPLI